MTYFREVQPLYRNPILWLALAVTAGALVLPSVRDGFRAGAPWAPAIPALLFAWLLFTRLETEVRDTGVRLRFRGLWFPKTFAWDAIEGAEGVTYRPLLQYGGWGIRRGLREWAWNVSGSEGVRLHLAGGNSFLIGSAKADRLAEAIRERLASGKRPSGP
jgi:hypothetical protein